MNQTLEAHELRLRFVPAENVLLHEESDPARVARLKRAVEHDGFLRNPPVVAMMNENQYVVLDGATRTTMLKELGAEHIIVQTVPYEDTSEVILGAWYHVLPEAAALEVDRFAAEHEAEVVRFDTLHEAHKALESRYAIAAIAHENGSASAFRIPPRGFSTPNGLLRALVSVYGGAGEIYRIVHDDLVNTVRYQRACPETVMFPTFSPLEIMNAARTNDVLPAGITRHQISGRALNINIDLNKVLRQETLSQKNQWLASWLRDKILSKKVRYYHEPVFVFDD